jgi:hypothetical protein
LLLELDGGPVHRLLPVFEQHRPFLSRRPRCQKDDLQGLYSQAGGACRVSPAGTCEPQIARAWVVRKQTVDGIVTSLELYNDAGESVALFFSKRKPGEAESEQWRALLSQV